MKSIREWFGYCIHQWKIIQTIDIYRHPDDGPHDKVGKFFVLQCEKCGDIMKRRV